LDVNNLRYNQHFQREAGPMNFDWATIHYPDGRVARVPPSEFLVIPLGERIELLTGGRIKFEKDNQPISPMDAIKKK
jgi:hypothetical protein